MLSLYEEFIAPQVFGAEAKTRGGNIEAPARNIYPQVWITFKSTDTV